MRMPTLPLTGLDVSTERLLFPGAFSPFLGDYMRESGGTLFAPVDDEKEKYSLVSPSAAANRPPTPDATTQPVS